MPINSGENWPVVRRPYPAGSEKTFEGMAICNSVRLRLLGLSFQGRNEGANFVAAIIARAVFKTGRGSE